VSPDESGKIRELEQRINILDADIPDLVEAVEALIKAIQYPNQAAAYASQAQSHADVELAIISSSRRCFLVRAISAPDH
jgi:hypothetical protein